MTLFFSRPWSARPLSSRLSLLVAGGCLLLPACGNSDADSPTTATNTPPGSAGQAGTGGQGGAAIGGHGGTGGTSSGGAGANAGNAGSGAADSQGGHGGTTGGQGGASGQSGSAGKGQSGSAGQGQGGFAGSGSTDLSGSFVAYCLTSLGNGDPTKSILFAADLQQNGATLSAKLTPLLTTATSLKDTSGQPTTATAQVTSKQANLGFGTVDVPGNANAISGSDIEIGNTILRTMIQSNDRACAELDGQLTKPFAYSLDDPGDICILLRATADGPLPPRPDASGFSCDVQMPPAYDPADKQKYRTDPASAALPPGPAAEATPDGTGPTIQAFSKIFLGDTDRQGVPGSDAWEGYGFDIDGLSSTADNTYHCHPAEGAKIKDIFVSGPGGLDNSYGKNIVPIFSGVVSDPSANANQSLENGDFSLLLSLDKLGLKADYTSVHTQLFASRGTADSDGQLIPPTAAQLSAGTYVWHPLPELLNPDGTSQQSFSQGYLTGNTFVSGTTTGDIVFLQSLSGVSLPLFIHQARLSVKLTPDHRTGSLGTIGGVLTTEEFVGALKKLAGTLSSSLCSGSTFDSIATQIRQASDIMSDGTQDPTKVCDAISIGLGFETVTALLGDPAPVSPPSPDPCQ